MSTSEKPLEVRLAKACEAFNDRKWYDAELGYSRAADLRGDSESHALQLLLGAIKYFVSADMRTVKKGDLIGAVEMALTGAVEFEQSEVARRVAARQNPEVTP